MTTEPTLTAKGLATRQRIIEAATAEFARHGIAGARVERIVAQARTNKAQLYDYFSGKEQLFDVIFEASLRRILTVVPVDADDLADWAVRLYDQCLELPDLIRIATWHRLERRPTGHLVAGLDRLDGALRQAIARGQESGALVDGRPFDVLAVVIAMSMTWSPVSNVYAASAAEDAAVHDARRSLLHRAVTGAIAGGRSHAP